MNATFVFLFSSFDIAAKKTPFHDSFSALCTLSRVN